MSGELKVWVAFTGDTVDFVAWNNISADVMSVKFSRGRKRPTDPWGANTATLVLSDQDRDYDPLNTTGPWGSNVVAGKQIFIQVRDPDDRVIRQWLGYTREWSPNYYLGDSAAVTTVRCVDRLGGLNQSLPLFPNDLMSRKAAGDRGVYYIFEEPFVTPATGDIQDLSGNARSGTAYTNWITKTAGAVTSAGNGISLQSANDLDLIVAAAPPETLASTSGFGFAAEITAVARDPGDVSGDTERWPILGDGAARQVAPVETGWNLYLEEDRVGNATAGTNPMRLRFRSMIDGVVGPTRALVAGTRDDWVGQRRAVVIGVDADQYTMGCVVPEGRVGSIGGSASLQVATTWPLRGLDLPEIPDGSWRAEIGREYDSNQNLPTFHGNVYWAGLFLAPAPESWVTALLDSIENRGLIAPETAANVDAVIDNVQMPPGFFINNVGEDVARSPLGTDGPRSVLEFLQQVVTMGHGWLYQDNMGDVVLQTIQRGLPSFPSGPTLTDQVIGPELEWVPFKDDSARIMSTYDNLVNHVEVTTPSGHIAEASDAASILAHGKHSRTYSLPFATNAAADQFAADVITFRSSPDMSSSVVLEPDAPTTATDPLAMTTWDLLEATDIGERLVLDRQPLGVGTITTLFQSLEGEEWTYSASTGRFSVRVFMGPYQPDATP